MIYLLRHGETEFNLQGRYQGWSDSPLTARGREQGLAYGRLLAAHIKATRIWTSPLPRALATAELIAKQLSGAGLQQDDRLREVSLGIWDGMTRQEIAVGWPGIRKAHPPRQWMFHAPEGERLTGLLSRLQSVLDEAAAEPEVILVSHGIAGRLLRGLHAGLPVPEALQLDAPQDVVFRLGPNRMIDRLG
ncbi:histidine phosphatase family protein [Paracoccus aestuariivivens]|uniref:Histidine phosphatase family protein n=1 Tax=Paracoccus aestuariivivens TaxID=1820333 RepID=A0A6L6J9T5_9RHOB|nr:histidine phosphatase family protein [Paracoccus aestuariivivens]MTH77905.1 histidine phosphatase family protein [Paracoccus aestuariivivens]